MTERAPAGGAGWLALAVAALVLAAPGLAEAYPQWQFSSGTARCAQCHYAPAGGGIVTGYARDAVGEELSSFEGDGAFLHGAFALPKALALQFDGRYAALTHDNGAASGPRQHLFPMQADLAARVLASESVSVVAVLGYRGQARNTTVALGAGAAVPAGGSRFISREHYVMWRPAANGPYVRAGRFFAPFGLRLAEHNLYVRRDLGFNLLEETYNVSGGFVAADSELHVTAFAPDFLRQAGGRDAGAAALYEHRLGDVTALGAQARVAFGQERQHVTVGGFFKRWFAGAGVLLQSELDVVHTRISRSNVSAQSLVGYLGASYCPLRGLFVTPFVERVQTAIREDDSATNAGGVQLNWFPYPHVELALQGRAQLPAGAREAITTALAILHYYL